MSSVANEGASVTELDHHVFRTHPAEKLHGGGKHAVRSREGNARIDLRLGLVGRKNGYGRQALKGKIRTRGTCIEENGDLVLVGIVCSREDGILSDLHLHIKRIGTGQKAVLHITFVQIFVGTRIAQNSILSFGIHQNNSTARCMILINNEVRNVDADFLVVIVKRFSVAVSSNAGAKHRFCTERRQRHSRIGTLAPRAVGDNTVAKESLPRFGENTHRKGDIHIGGADHQNALTHVSKISFRGFIKLTPAF